MKDGEKAPLETLREEQAKFDAKKGEETRAAEARKVAEDEAKGKAGGEHQEMLDLRAESKKLYEEYEQMKVEGTASRIENNEAIRSDIGLREERMGEMRGAITSLESEVQEIQALDSGHGLAENVATQLESSKQELITAQQEAEAFATELEGLKSSVLDDEQIEKFQQLDQQLHDIEDRVNTIMQNEHVITLMMGDEEKGIKGEAKNEDEFREGVVRALRAQTETSAVYPSTETRNGKARLDYLKILAQKFIEEEFEAFGINQLRDPEQRTAAMQTLCRDMMKGFSPEMIRVGGGDLVQNQKYPLDMAKRVMAGSTLLQLSGKLRSPENVIDYPHEEWDEGRHKGGDAGESIRARKFILKHLDSLNYVLSVSHGAKGPGKQITNFDSESKNDHFSTDLWHAGFRQKENGEVYPVKPEEMTSSSHESISKDEKEYSQADLDRISEEYATNGSEAGEWAREILDVQRAAIERQKALVEAIKPMLQDAKIYQRDLDRFRNGSETIANAIQRLTAQKEKADQEITDAHQKIEGLEKQRFGLFDSRGKETRRIELTRIKSWEFKKRQETTECKRVISILQEISEKTGGKDRDELGSDLQQAENRMKILEDNLRSMEPAKKDGR